ncbi:hypothetical protein ACPEEZ_00730 [Frigoribacterium sp. 2-23]|uniref:hypothetical protein n=1 Tax=Frigoribacterium sp. 2-23 TaxID=3415006 RepID=UPI003C701F0D
MAPAESRDRRTRDLASRAFARLLDAVGPHWQDMVLIGGLVPDTLVDGDEPHQGTLDVDVLLPLALQYDQDDDDFGWLEIALQAAGFSRANEGTGWRWLTDVDGFPVVVEFLTDVPDSQGQEIVLPGTFAVTAMNLEGPGPALRNTRVADFGGKTARVAGVGGYLAAKAAAIVGRGKAKDLYDFAYVVVNGVRESATAVALSAAAASHPDAAWHRDPRHDIRAAIGLYTHLQSDGPRHYAAESRAAGSSESEADLALDAVIAVRQFVDAFETAIGQ